MLISFIAMLKQKLQSIHKIKIMFLLLFQIKYVICSYSKNIILFISESEFSIFFILISLFSLQTSKSWGLKIHNKYWMHTKEAETRKLHFIVTFINIFFNFHKRICIHKQFSYFNAYERNGQKWINHSQYFLHFKLPLYTLQHPRAREKIRKRIMLKQKPFSKSFCDCNNSLLNHKED